MSSSCGCMLLMDWKSESTALSLVMLRPRMWLLFMRLRKVVTAFCRAFKNCSWFSSDSPFWYCCYKWERSKAQKVICCLPINIQGNLKMLHLTSAHSTNLKLPPLCWPAGQGRDFLQAEWLQGGAQPMAQGRGLKGWDSSAPLPVSSPSMFCSGNVPAGIMWYITISIISTISML